MDPILVGRHKKIVPGPSIAIIVILPATKNLVVQEIEKRKEQAKRWVDEADKSGVSTMAKVEHKQIGSISEIILDQAKKKPGLIAMASRSGPLESALLGGFTRKIVRGSP